MTREETTYIHMIQPEGLKNSDHGDRNRNLQISRAPLKSQAQGTSLFTSAGRERKTGTITRISTYREIKRDLYVHRDTQPDKEKATDSNGFKVSNSMN